MSSQTLYMICHTHANCRVGLPDPAVPVRVMIRMDPGLLWAETSFRQSLKSLDTKLQGNCKHPTRGVHGVRLTAGAGAVRPTEWCGLGGRQTFLSSVFLLQPLFFCLARLEQSNDRVGIRYTRHWSQLMEPSVPAMIAAISLFPILPLLYSKP